MRRKVLVAAQQIDGVERLSGVTVFQAAQPRFPSHPELGAQVTGPTTSSGSRREPLTLDEALEAVRAHWSSLHAMARSLLRDTHLAQDAVQDACVAMIKHQPEFLDEAAVLRWTRTVVLNGCRSGLRRRVVARRYLRTLRDETAPAAEDVAVVNEADARVLALLSDLPARQREVLTLRYLSQLDDAEISAVTGISPGAVRSTASRALATLSKRLEHRP